MSDVSSRNDTEQRLRKRLIRAGVTDSDIHRVMARWRTAHEETILNAARTINNYKSALRNLQPESSANKIASPPSPASSASPADDISAIRSLLANAESRLVLAASRMQDWKDDIRASLSQSAQSFNNLSDRLDVVERHLAELVGSVDAKPRVLLGAIGVAIGLGLSATFVALVYVALR